MYLMIVSFCLQLDIMVVVGVVNLNDNSPVFAENPYNVNFTEVRV